MYTLEGDFSWVWEHESKFYFKWALYVKRKENLFK